MYLHNHQSSTMSKDFNRKRKAEEDLGVTDELKRQKQTIQPEKTVGFVTDVNIERFAASRAVEIQALTEVVKYVGGNHTAFQKLPRHMRRRAMSHNIKRVPRRLHNVVRTELERTKAPGKRPSRRHRRRPSNLLSEYERRKRRIAWLETHIWHAKRFKMVEKWGYKLALHPNDKSTRACYRAVNRHCMMQDVSYESYIEVKGPRQNIIDGLSHLTSEETGPTFASKMTSPGTREGHLHLYAYDKYPLNCIGPVKFIWRPSVFGVSADETVAYLWICCHPSFFNQALEEIRMCFQSTSETAKIDNSRTDTLSASDMNVQVTSMKDLLVKFSLFGPASNLILSEVLKPAHDDVLHKSHAQEMETEVKFRDTLVTGSAATSKPEIESAVIKNEKTPCKEIHETCNALWWKKLYLSTVNRDAFQKQFQIWSLASQCQSPAEAPPHSVLALTVGDPRLLIPPKRVKVSTVNQGHPTATSLPLDLFTPSVSDSPLWDHQVREQVKASKISEQNLNELKSRQLVPGTQLILGDQESRVPVILIQRPGADPSSGPSGFGSGWDVILPSGWAMAFWVALVYRGARVGGVREVKTVNLQSGQLLEPYDFPDSSAGADEMKIESEYLQSRHDRRPPAKRPNFTKLGIPSPYVFQFQKLAKEWVENQQKSLQGPILLEIAEKQKWKIYVLKNRKLLRLLNLAVTDMKSFLKLLDKGDMSRGKGGRTKDDCDKVIKKDIYSKITSIVNGQVLMEQHSHSLVPVHLKIIHRGVPAAYAHICIPSSEDLTLLTSDKNFSGPIEPLHKDMEEKQRKQERKMRLKLRKKKKGRGTHKNLKGMQVHEEDGTGHGSLQALTNNSIKTPGLDKNERNQISATPELSSISALNTETQYNLDFKQAVDSDGVDLINSTSRLIIGFVRNGGFDLGQGQGSGIGFCSVSALLHLVQEQQSRKACLVLVRNPSSLQYRFASLSVVF